MNCKPGDLAYIVAPYARHGRGYFVTVERPARYTETLNGTNFYSANQPGAGWVCTGSVPANDRGVMYTRLVVSDRCLRPIRDQPGEDETIKWAGLPVRKGVPA